MEPFLGEIRIFAGNFAPVGWQFCHGQLLPISLYEALFTLLGTTYGGDGQSTFALPDFRGRVPLHPNQSTGQYPLGASGGTETVTLTQAQMPVHTHLMSASSAAPAAVPAGGLDLSTTPMVPGSPLPKPKMYADPAALVAMAPGAIQPQGNWMPHSNMAPSLAMSFIIAVEGIFPSFN